jgi:L-threonylcarbamoyladenylate synthase
MTDLIDDAVARLRAGGLVAFPTETVYGLGADVSQPDAVRRIFALKGRPADHPLIVHIASAAELDLYARDIPPAATKLATAFWPGPLTMILRRSDRVSDVVTGGLDTVALRVPRHPVALDLLQRLGGGIAAPSANRFGRVSPTRAEHVRDEFPGEDLLILPGAPCAVGLESTIIDLSSPAPAILRPGGVTEEQIAAVLTSDLAAPDETSPRCSGRLESHYAPRAKVVVVSADQPQELARVFVSAAMSGQRVCAIAPANATLPLNMKLFAAPTAAEPFAAAMYDLLRRADAENPALIIVMPPPEQGLGVAIWDRLRKAAAARE